MRPESESSALLAHTMPDYTSKDRIVEVLKQCSSLLEKSEGFATALKEILSHLERSCSMKATRINFLNGVLDIGPEIHYVGPESAKDPVVEEAIQSAIQSVENLAL